jgi:hypothetical protein
MWLKEDAALLGTMSDGEVAAQVGRSRTAVTHKRRRLGIPPFRQQRSQAFVPVKKARPEGPVIQGKTITWLMILAMIGEYSVNSSDICAALGVSRSACMHYLNEIRRVYGVDIQFQRPDGRYPGWYVIHDWGILRKDRVIARYRSSAFRQPSASPVGRRAPH